MKNKILFSGIGIITMVVWLSSCVKDLNITPIDPHLVTSGNIGANDSILEGALAKVYVSFMINGQGGSDAAGTGEDIVTDNDDFNTYFRAMWNLQELTTDEASCAWGDAGIAPLNTQQFQSNNPFLTAIYDRTVLSVSYANSVVGYTKGSTDPKKILFNAEARFLRALSYTYAMDMFANPPFITENSPIGVGIYPKQLSPTAATGRAMLFNYVVGELRAISHKMGAPGFSFPRADQGACWMLLARLYLNAGIYTGTAKWDSCVMYCDSVINNTGGAYALAQNYRLNFGSNNYYPNNKEMIFGWACNGIYTQGSVGSTFLIESCSNGSPYINAATMLGLPQNANWGGNRGKLAWLNEMVDTMTLFASNGGYIPTLHTHMDSIFGTCPDQRVYCHVLLDNQMYNTSEYVDGIGEYKFTNNQVSSAFSPGGVNDVLQAPNYFPQYSSTAVPVFRLADAYLMRAEAGYNLNGAGATAAVLSDLNTVRARANAAPAMAGDLNALQITSPSGGNTSLYFLYERGREFYYEAQRRTDLVRFGQFVSGSYMWTWKGGTFAGTNLNQAYLNIFPLPATELKANPNIVQNPNY